MSALIPVDINGVQYQVHGEFTSAAVATEFQNSLAAFVNIFNIGLPNANITGIDPDSITLSTDIKQKLEDPSLNYAEQLENALNGGVVIRNFEVDGKTPTSNTVVGLLNLVKDGLSVTNNPNDADPDNPDPSLRVFFDPVLRTGQHFLSLEMAGALEQLIRSLQMAGIIVEESGGRLTVASGSITSTMINNWKNLSASSDAIRAIMQFAVDTSGNQNRTLQALVELIYVRTGNEMLSDNLERLEDAIGVTKGSLEALNSLQTLHNKITAEDKAKFQDVFPGFGETTEDIFRSTFFGVGFRQTFVRTTIKTASPTQFVRGVGGSDGVVKAADEHFAGIDPTLLDQITEADRIEFLSLRTTLLDEIRALSAQTGQDVEGTLLEKMRNVLIDIHKAFSAVDVPSGAIISITDGNKIASALTRWILDSTGSVETSLNIPGLNTGQIQRNLTAAVSAGQSLNDAQKQEVRRILFVFEEYYKSAAAILSKVTQILERMAQAIAR